MAGKIVRAGIVGASSLLGKELATELSGSDIVVWDLTLLDPEVVETGGVRARIGGQIASAGDEVTLIQTITPDAFNGMDVVLFAGSTATTMKHWKLAQSAGAKVVDASGALYDVAGQAVRSPWMDATGSKPVTGTLIISAHPAAVMLSLVMSRISAKWPEARCNATVMEPASQQGSAGLDELQEQTVALLTFQSIPKDLYGSQVAFNLSASSPSEAVAKLSDVSTTVERDLISIAGEKVAGALALQFVQAPVFSGYTASMYVSLDASADEVKAALDGNLLSVITDDEEGPTNLSATEQGRILISVREDRRGEVVHGIWLWVAADNLKLAASNAAACAALFA